jgi:hypothetical protein
MDAGPDALHQGWFAMTRCRSKLGVAFSLVTSSWPTQEKVTRAKRESLFIA